MQVGPAPSQLHFGSNADGHDSSSAPDAHVRYIEFVFYQPDGRRIRFIFVPIGLDAAVNRWTLALGEQALPHGQNPPQ
jgi:hypothetical protein